MTCLPKSIHTRARDGGQGRTHYKRRKSTDSTCTEVLQCFTNYKVLAYLPNLFTCLEGTFLSGKGGKRTSALSETCLGPEFGDFGPIFA